MKNIKRTIIIAAMGLGLGIGVSLSVLSNLSPISATHEMISGYRIIPESIRTTSDSTYYLGDQSALRYSNGGSLGELNTTIISGSDDALYAELAGYALGDSIEVLGSNNGLYRYALTGIYTVSRSESVAVTDSSSSSLLLRLRQHIWDTTDRVYQFSFSQ